MGVMRLGYVHVKVTDMAEARQHYSETVGLYETGAADGKVYFKGWDEWDHHSLVLEEGGVGLVRLGMKVRKPEELAQFESAAQKFGYTVTRFSKGENAEVGDGFTVHMLGHQVDFYQDMTYLGVDVGVLNPMSHPRNLKGIGAPFLDHMLLKGDDLETAERFFVDVLDFAPVERMVASMDDGAPLIATWLSCSSKTHDIALLKGEDGGLHHFTFQLRDWGKVQDAADTLVHDDVPIDLGPTRHGITRGETIYFFDPSGNRNEVFAGGYNFNYDRPCVTWTMDQLARGLDYYKREVTETFLTVYT